MTDPTSSTRITGVRIAEGCIVCNLCEETCPQVFQVLEETCVIREAAQRFFQSHAGRIAQAAEECPVAVIRVAGVNDQ